MSDGRGEKWKCEFCTYENYPAAKKCTMCFKWRALHVISDTINEEQDIYKMAPVPSSDSSLVVNPSSGGGSSCIGSSSSSELNKWSCEYCTYINWAKSSKCVQCLNPKRKSSPSATNSQSQDRTNQANQLGTISVHITENSNSGSSGGSGRNITPSRLSPNNSSTSSNTSTTSSSSYPNNSVKESNNDINKSSMHKGNGSNHQHQQQQRLLSSSGSKKWICLKCTYENWPRSQKCIICSFPRGKSSSASSPSESIMCLTNTNNTIVSGRGGGVRCGSTTTTTPSPPPRHHSPPTPSSPGSLSPRNQLANLGENCQHQLQLQDHVIGASASSGALPSSPSPSTPPSTAREKRLMMLHAQMRDCDWLWLNACKGAVDGDMEAIHAFIAAGGHPSRQLTLQEAELLSRPSAFQVGYTLVHLAIRFQREDMLAILLTATDSAKNAAKRLPCMTCPDMATDIRRHIVSSIRQRKGIFPCSYLTDCATFSLPADIDDLAHDLQEQLYDEILDRDVQNELEVEESIINWSIELTDHLGSRLYALWNRTAGDCLLDSVLQATWGVFDLDYSLRRCLSDSLKEGAMNFYPRWKEYESRQADALHFSLDESQWQHDWSVLINLASQPGASLEQTHIFALAHILRRPIIVYGVKYIKSFRGETLGYAKFQGVYLPLLWDSSFCWKNPVALGYTRGHFSALVPMETDLDDGMGAGANIESTGEDQVAYLPLVDCEGNLLQIHFLSGSEVGREEKILREWLHLHKTKGGLLVSTQRQGKRPMAVKQMVAEWLDHYRQLQTQQQEQPAPSSLSIKNNFSSDGESDDE